MEERNKLIDDLLDNANMILVSISTSVDESSELKKLINKLKELKKKTPKEQAVSVIHLFSASLDLQLMGKLSSEAEFALSAYRKLMQELPALRDPGFKKLVELIQKKEDLINKLPKDSVILALKDKDAERMRNDLKNEAKSILYNNTTLSREVCELLLALYENKKEIDKIDESEIKLTDIYADEMAHSEESTYTSHEEEQPEEHFMDEHIGEVKPEIEIKETIKNAFEDIDPRFDISQIAENENSLFQIAIMADIILQIQGKQLKPIISLENMLYYKACIDKLYDLVKDITESDREASQHKELIESYISLLKRRGEVIDNLPFKERFKYKHEDEDINKARAQIYEHATQAQEAKQHEETKAEAQHLDQFDTVNLSILISKLERLKKKFVKLVPKQFGDEVDYQKLKISTHGEINSLFYKNNTRVSITKKAKIGIEKLKEIDLIIKILKSDEHNANKITKDSLYKYLQGLLLRDNLRVTTLKKQTHERRNLLYSDTYEKLRTYVRDFFVETKNPEVILRSDLKRLEDRLKKDFKNSYGADASVYPDTEGYTLANLKEEYLRRINDKKEEPNDFQKKTFGPFKDNDLLTLIKYKEVKALGTKLEYADKGQIQNTLISMLNPSSRELSAAGESYNWLNAHRSAMSRFFTPSRSTACIDDISEAFEKYNRSTQNQKGFQNS